jgi:hypothetical protein
MNIEKNRPYVYQPYGMQHHDYWESGRIYGVSGFGGMLAKINGLTKQEAEAVCVALINSIDAQKTETISNAIFHGNDLHKSAFDSYFIGDDIVDLSHSIYVMSKGRTAEFMQKPMTIKKVLIKYET